MQPVSVARRRVVVAGDHHDDGVGQRGAQAVELMERVEDRGVRRPDRVEHVAGEEDDIRLERDDRSIARRNALATSASR